MFSASRYRVDKVDYNEGMINSFPQYLPRTITLPDGHDINLIGATGLCTQTSYFESVPLTAAFAEAQESYGWPEIKGPF